MQVYTNARFVTSELSFEEKLVPLKAIRLLFEEDHRLLQVEWDLFEMIRDLLQEDRDLLQEESLLFRMNVLRLREGARFTRRRGDAEKIKTFLSGLETRPIPSDRRTRVPNGRPSPTSLPTGGEGRNLREQPRRPTPTR